MAEIYDVVAKVICQEGHCGAGHKVGDEFIIGLHTPNGMCCSAFHSVFPMARVLRFGGSLPWSDDPDTCTAACPDERNPVTFQLRRLKR